MSVEVRESGNGRSWLRPKLLAAVFAALLLAGIVLSYLVRGTEGIAIFVALAIGLGIMFGWRAH